MKAPLPPVIYEEKQQPIIHNTNPNLREVDYSEYEWMEHIDEFDKEVLRVLEEEEAMFEAYFSEYFDLDDIDDCENYIDDEVGVDNDEYVIANIFDGCLYQDVKSEDYLVDQFSVLNTSTLNPEAPEFQPKFS